MDGLGQGVTHSLLFTVNSAACGLKSSDATEALMFPLSCSCLTNVANDATLLPPEKHPWHLKQVREYVNPSGSGWVFGLHETL